MLSLSLGVDLILASQSPRRKQALEDLGLKFSVQTADINETRKSNETPKEFVSRMAAEKAQKVAIEFPTSWILAADTDVFIDDEVFGKPVDEQDAYRMLKAISGRDHSVWSAFCLMCEDSGKSSVVATESVVSVVDIPDEAIRAYIASGDPLDKAAAYGIQGGAGQFISSINGDFFSIVGLNVCGLVQKLREFGLVTYV